MNILEKIKLLPDALQGFLISDPNSNGEYKYLRKSISEGMIIFDVGANIGDYSEKILSINPKVTIYCFEPVQTTFQKLSSRLSHYSNVKLNNVALGETNKEEYIFVYGNEAGSNSLYYHKAHAVVSDNIQKEKIQIKKLDDIIKEQQISKIDFLKIDVEGNEINVLKGGSDSLKNGIIKAIQFEYNDFWISSNSKLEEMLEILKHYNYVTYRLTPFGKIKINSFKKSLENYKQSNYLAMLGR